MICRAAITTCSFHFLTARWPEGLKRLSCLYDKSLLLLNLYFFSEIIKLTIMSTRKFLINRSSIT